MLARFYRARDGEKNRLISSNTNTPTKTTFTKRVFISFCFLVYFSHNSSSYPFMFCSQMWPFSPQVTGRSYVPIFLSAHLLHISECSRSSLHNWSQIKHSWELDTASLTHVCISNSAHHIAFLYGSRSLVLLFSTSNQHTATAFMILCCLYSVHTASVLLQNQSRKHNWQDKELKGQGVMLWENSSITDDRQWVCKISNLTPSLYTIHTDICSNNWSSLTLLLPETDP